MSNKEKAIMVEGSENKDSAVELETFSRNYDPKKLDTKTDASPLAIGGMSELKLEKLKLEDIEKYLLMNPIVPRGIEIKANRMIERGYKVISEDKEVSQYCHDILENSGGKIFLKKLVMNAHAFGFGPATLVPNSDDSEIIRCNIEHPVYFRISKYPKDYEDKDLREKLKIDKNTKKPVAFTQYRFDTQGNPVMYGDEIESNMVVYLVFDTWGDEAEGVSVLQYLHRDVQYLMNIDEGGAETMYRNGFNQKKLKTKARTKKQMEEVAQNVKNLNVRDVIILPEGGDVENLTPGSTDFKQYHGVFVNNIAVKLGVPMPLLSLTGTETNKSTLKEQRKDMRSDFGADEEILKQTIEEQLFYSACKFKYGEEFERERVPKFMLNEIIEDKETRTNILTRQSQYIANMANAAETLVNIGFKDKADKVLRLLEENIEYDRVFDKRTDLDVDKVEKTPKSEPEEKPTKQPEEKPEEKPEQPVEPEPIE